MTTLTESDVEAAALDWLADLGRRRTGRTPPLTRSVPSGTTTGRSRSSFSHGDSRRPAGSAAAEADVGRGTDNSQGP